MITRSMILTLLAALALNVAACRATQGREEGSGQAESTAKGAHRASSGEHAGEKGEHEEAHVRLSPEQMTAFEVTVTEAGPGTVDLGLELPCEVHPNGDRLAHIVPRFPGIVKDVRKTIGDVVHAGDVLAVIESSESLAPYQLSTLMDGTIIEKHLTRGEAVDREKQVFAIADLSAVWVDCSVFQKDLGRVSVGRRVRVSAGIDAPDAEGEISYITPVVDQPTRTATARVVLENTEGLWRPGMFVAVRVLAPASVAIAVPHGAVQTIGPERVVFVEAEDGFVPRPVKTGRSGGDRVEILSGLAPGERYVAANAFLLKAELGKGSAEHED